MHYLYRITNRLNGKVYIGQSNNNRRWSQHTYFAKHPEKTGQYIHRAMAKHGVKNFVFEVLDFGLNQWHIDCLEDNYIQMYDSRNKEHGYNLTPGGGGVGSGKDHPNYGKKQSQETIDKRANKLVGQKRTPEQRAQMSEAQKASNKPQYYIPEVRQKMSESHLGKTLPEEQREKISQGVKENWDKRNAERFAAEDIRCHAPGCQVSGKAAYKIIDGVRYCNMHGLRLWRNGTLEKLPPFKYTEDNPMPDEVRKKCGIANIGKVAHNRIEFTPEQITHILDDPRGNKRIAKDFGVTEKVIIRVKNGKY